MISVRYNMVSGKSMEFINVQSDIMTLSSQCADNVHIVMRGGNGKDVVIAGLHVESLEEL